ncbi:hemolymph lipopolysaccharide-binding protein-like [Anabrus simplex]|uniref:hemolymph lipopolysaccharide-binding protein-like n=1 Tax=Anabrus simplex TaxID=316456 RepID=UPI0035A2AD0B
MLSSTTYVIVIVLLVIESSDASICSSDEEVFQFSISSKKNSSHHRILKVDLNSAKPAKTNDSGEITLDVEHGRSMCNGGERLRLSTSVSVLEIVPRRDDYELFPGIGYYKLHTTGQPWETAREICDSEGAHLIVINSFAEASVVREYFSRKPTFSGSSDTRYIFAGFHDKYTEGDFVTVTGVPLSKSGYTMWESGQPNGKYDQNFGGISAEGLLFDIRNGWKLGFICEQEL